MSGSKGARNESSQKYHLGKPRRWIFLKSSRKVKPKGLLEETANGTARKDVAVQKDNCGVLCEMQQKKNPPFFQTVFHFGSNCREDAEKSPHCQGESSTTSRLMWTVN